MARCKVEKKGKFARLRCFCDLGHEGPHNFVVVGVRPHDPKPGSRQKRSDVEYKRGQEKSLRRKAAQKAKE